MNNQLTHLFRVILLGFFSIACTISSAAQPCASFEVEANTNGYVLFPSNPGLSQFGGDSYWTITMENLPPYIVEGTEILVYNQTLELIGTQGAEICFTWGEANTECPFSYCQTYTYDPDFGLQATAGNTTCNPSFNIVIGENGMAEFVNTSSSNAGPAEYIWSFGDESPAQDGAFASHTYNAPGTYQVCLEMYISEGNSVICESVYCQEINIELPQPPCESGLFPFSVAITTCCEVDNSNFAVFSINGTDNDFSLFGEISLTNIPGVFSESVCLPQGCYEIQFDYGLMNQMVGQTESIEYGSPYMTNLQILDLFENLPWNSTFCIEESVSPICPTAIVSESVDCNTFIFGLMDAEGDETSWDFGDDTPIIYGQFADHSYEENGVYIVTAEHVSPNCPDGVTIIYTVVVECANGGCPESMSANATNNCGEYNFYVNNAGPNAQVTWNFTDGSQPITTFNEITYQYEQAGVYEVCATVVNPNCPQGNVICNEIEILPCNYNECPTFINSENIDCNTLVFNINDENIGYALWDFGDGISDYYFQGNPQHSYEENGIYVVTAEYFGPGCEEGFTLIYTAVIECQDENCPDTITITDAELCHQFVFEVNNWGESLYGDILWSFGDNEGYGQNEFLHMYLEPGNYEVCAEGTTEQCPSGFSICAPFQVDACGGDVTGDGCPDVIWVYPLSDCGLWHFEAGQFEAENESVLWNWGDGTTSEGNTIMNHQYAEDGIYIVELTYASATCEESTIIVTVEANACETPDCPQQIWSGPGDLCGVMLFEAGGFVEGEEFIWYFGDGTSAEGGHFITHEYEEPGTYTVCCYLSNSNCPGYQLCTVAVIEPCNTNCTNVVIGLDSEVNNGGTPAIYYSLSSANGELIASGQAQYSETDPFFDMMHCLPEGCYYLTVDNNNPISIGEGFYVFITAGNNNIMENAEIVYQDDISFTILFGINSDCTGDETCEAAFEAIYTSSPGHIEFINNSIYSGNAEFLWSYGNGETSDGQFGNVWYDENNTYEVCLTVTTDNCTDTYCTPVLVENIAGGCETNAIVITATGAFTSNTTELLEIFVAQNDIEIESWTMPYNNQMMSITYEMCLADGCYSFNVQSDTPIQAENISVVVSSNNNVIGEYEFDGNITSEFFVFGLNMDCTIHVNEDSALSSLDVYPVPANDMITITSGNSATPLQLIELLDMSGKIVAAEHTSKSIVTLSTDQYASGIYVLRIQSAGEVSTRRIQIAH